MITTVPTVPVQQGRRGIRRKTRLFTPYRLIEGTRFDDLNCIADSRGLRR